MDGTAFRVRFLFVLFLSAAVLPTRATAGDEKEKANRLAHEFILVDTHVDLPLRMFRRWTDITVRSDKSDFDYVRAQEGGLNAPFMSVYVPSERESNGAKGLADSLIDLVESIVAHWPDKFAIAKSPDDVRIQFKKGLMSLPMGMENGAPIEGNLANVKHFYARGISYITLTHGKDNHICDSSYDTTHTWGGLSPFGETLVQEMNRVGIMVDISHITDDAAEDVFRVTRAPVIASHSSCRFFTPGWERNLPDDLIKTLAKNGGVIMINFGSSFLSEEFMKKEDEARSVIMSYLRSKNLRYWDQEAQDYIKKYTAEHPLPFPDVGVVVDHIDHVVSLVGVDHVGLGSDFEGVGPTLPIGLKSVSDYPNIIEELLKRGYSDPDIKKICGENLLRVWGEVRRAAANLQSTGK